MALALFNVASHDNGAVVVNLEYDDVTLAVSAIQAENGGVAPLFVEIQNSQNAAQDFKATLQPGANRRQALPNGAASLRMVTGPDGGQQLSFTPWNINTSYPA